MNARRVNWLPWSVFKIPGVAGRGFFQCLDAEFDIHADRYAPGEHPPARTTRGAPSDNSRRSPSCHGFVVIDSILDTFALLQCAVPAKDGEVPIFEPGLAAMVKKCEAAGHLRFTTDVEAAVHHGEIQLFAVGTPSSDDGADNLNRVLAAARNIGRHMKEYKVVVDRSTVPVGTADKVHREISAELKQRGVAIKFSVVANSEFLKEGAAEGP